MAVFKKLYRGVGIYWHGFVGHAGGYGDETHASFATMQDMQDAIDNACEANDAQRQDHLRYWDTLGHAEREKWRRLCQTTELSASELAWTNRKEGGK